ncbi:uncharacterized protein LOC100206068 isoform X1 [Hydra vulgaris]|uniref:uncharacterized protein LOC100206068 isoform X1 n=1 Tax=Hydra vulgaris TaxID=6087 RepID=UPI0006411C3D|nr:uncharacterized protein LOC100206068 isoform X1 [Hydra vulgaris]
MFKNIIKAIFILLLNFEKVISVPNPTGDITPGCFYYFNKTDPDPVISSPNFGYSNYPDSIKCGWMVETNTDLADLTLKIDRFHLEPNKLCIMFDYLIIYYQYTDENDWAVLDNREGYCGQLANLQPFVVNAKRMFIKFVSDISNSFPGFNATVHIAVTDAAPSIDCLGLLHINKLSCNDSVSVVEGDPLTISCQARLALPPAQYEYKRIVNGSVVNIDSTKIKALFQNGDILFQNLVIADSGIYQCTASNKRGVDNKTFELKVTEKCLCPKFIQMSWYNNPPYIYSSKSRNGSLIVNGIFPTVLTKMINDVCGQCELGHGPSEIVWDGNSKELSNTKKGYGDISKDVMQLDSSASGYDMIFPLSNVQNVDTYQNNYCVALLNSPGVALIVSKPNENASSIAMFNAILNAWPILVLVIVMATLAGILIWILETYWNEKQFPRSFTSGMGEGFWWAFVSMTTVGYGDIAPIAVPGRLFAVVWILTGLVLIAIFTGVMATSLTVTAMSTDIMLYGSVLGALNNTDEYRLGVNRNGIMKNYSSFQSMRAAMVNNEVKGMLLDMYVAGFYMKTDTEFRVQTIFQSSNTYCVLLGNDLNQKAVYDAFVAYTTSNTAVITKQITQNSNTLSPAGDSSAQSSAQNIFNPSNTLFLTSLGATLAMLFAFIIFGVLFEFRYLRPRQRMVQAAKNLEMISSPEVKEMATQVKLLKEYLLMEVNEFYERWSMKLTKLTKKHKLQQKSFLKKTAPKVRNGKILSTNTLHSDNVDGVDGSSSYESSLQLNEHEETKHL